MFKIIATTSEYSERPIQRDPFPLRLLDLDHTAEVSLVDALQLGSFRRRLVPPGDIFLDESDDEAVVDKPVSSFGKSSGSVSSGEESESAVVVQGGMDFFDVFGGGGDTSDDSDDGVPATPPRPIKRQNKEFTPERKEASISPTKKTPQRGIRGIHPRAEGVSKEGEEAGGNGGVTHYRYRSDSGEFHFAAKSPDTREAAMTSVDSPHVAKAELIDGLLLMPWATRGDFHSYLPKLSEFFRDEAVSNEHKLYMILNITEQLSLGLNHIHAQLKKSHMDAKPENILVYQTNTLAWADLGSISGEGESVPSYTPAFSPPEAFGDSFRSRLDIEDDPFRGNADSWSLGAILFRVVLGSHFFQRPDNRINVNSEMEIKDYIATEHNKTFPEYLEQCFTERFPDQEWSRFALDIIKNTLVISPPERLNASGIYDKSVALIKESGVVRVEGDIKEIWQSWHPKQRLVVPEFKEPK